MHLTLPWCLFDPAQDRQGPAQPACERTPRAALEERLFCAHCHAVITQQRARCEVQGGHEHYCTNPAGVRFHIGCFAAASGCITAGAASTEHTWFAGHSWTIALCGQCQAHLGWRFQLADNDFYGLILARLTSRGAS